MSEKFQLTEQWGLRKLQLGDRCEWALQYLGMDWIRMSEFLPNAPNIMDDDIRKFAEAVRALSLQDHATEARRLVDEQAKDEGLWFHAQTCAEAYLQAALRKLHAAVEGQK